MPDKPNPLSDASPDAGDTAMLRGDLYYIQNRGCVGNSARWWRVDGHGYTSNLNGAWRVTKEEAERICAGRRPTEDWPRLCSEMDGIAERHVDVQQIGGVNV